jgi:hypothetical protein
VALEVRAETVLPESTLVSIILVVAAVRVRMGKQLVWVAMVSRIQSPVPVSITLEAAVVETLSGPDQILAD